MDVTAIVQQEIAAVAAVRSWKARSIYVADAERHIYASIVVPDLPRPFPARVEVMARVVDDWIIIEEDTTDQPLFEALVRAGIPREKIICVYAGQSLPEPLT